MNSSVIEIGVSVKVSFLVKPGIINSGGCACIESFIAF